MNIVALINSPLFSFDLVPIAPLDGSKILPSSNRYKIVKLTD